MKSRAITVALITVAFTSPCSASDNSRQGQVKAKPAKAFVDDLATPSTKSNVAAKSLINGFAIAGSRVVAVGSRGHILYSDDHGKTWIQAAVPVSSVLTAVCFPSPKNGWAVGQDGVVLHSSDGGANWGKQLDGVAAAKIMQSYYGTHPLSNVSMEAVKRFANEPLTYPFLDVYFESDSTGYIVGAYNLIFQTTNGGKDWSPLYRQTDNPNRLHLFSIRQIDHDLYISGERGLLLKLDRKTGKFKSVKVPYNGTLFGIIGDKDFLVTYGLRGNMYVSRNKGNSWQKVAIDTESGLSAGAVTADGKIMIGSAEGQLFVSEDKGASFKLDILKHPQPVSAIAALNNHSFVLGGLLGIQELSSID